MTLIKNHNIRIPSILHSNLDEAFDIDAFLNGSLLEPPLLKGGRFTSIPGANIHETEKEFVMELAVPGMQKKDFHISVNDKLLEIEVEKEEEPGREKENYTKREYDYTAFNRSFNLPEFVLSDKIKAEYENGILKIQLPKATETKRKPVKAITVK